MIDSIANNPFLFLILLCLCNPPGLLTAGIVYWLAQNYDIRSPFTPRNEAGGDYEI